jgi:putative transposase
LFGADVLFASVCQRLAELFRHGVQGHHQLFQLVDLVWMDDRYLDALDEGLRFGGTVNLLSGWSRPRLVCHTRGMNTPAIHRYKHHRFPVEIISHAVWLYCRFSLSYCDVEELLFARGVIVSYEALRKWCRKFGQGYANQLRRRRPQPGDKWHLDEVFLTIKGERHYLWRAVDQDGTVLDILVQSRRNKQAAKKFFRKLLKGCQYMPRVIITDQLKSYGAAKRELLPGVEHRQHCYLNNRAENSHQPTRQRERRMQGFKSPGHAQRFLSAYGPIAQYFRPRRHRLSAWAYRQEM